MTVRIAPSNRMLIVASLESAVRLRKYLILVLASSALTACGLAGGPSPGPDEFAVVTRAPLSLPPDYGLRPPRPGAARPNEASPRDDAQAFPRTQRHDRRPAVRRDATRSVDVADLVGPVAFDPPQRAGDLVDAVAPHVEKHHERDIDEALYLAEVSDFDFEYDQWKERNL